MIMNNKKVKLSESQHQNGDIKTEPLTEVHQTEVKHQTENSHNEPHQEDRESFQKVSIEFPMSDLVRAQVPKVFDVVESVATQWVNDQKFENLGISNPLAEIVTIKALENAKKIEKKLEEKGVISAAKMGYQIAQLQLQSWLKKTK